MGSWLQVSRTRIYTDAAVSSTEAAEHFHRRPLEQIRRMLIEPGLFVQMHTLFNNFADHGYRGVSGTRSYLVFDALP